MVLPLDLDPRASVFAPADRGSREPAPDVVPSEPKRTAPGGVEMSSRQFWYSPNISALPRLFPSGANSLSHQALQRRPRTWQRLMTRRSAPQAEPTKPPLYDAVTGAQHAAPHDSFAVGRRASLSGADVAEVMSSPVELAVKALASRCFSVVLSSGSCWRVIPQSMATCWRDRAQWPIERGPV